MFVKTIVSLGIPKCSVPNGLGLLAKSIQLRQGKKSMGKAGKKKAEAKGGFFDAPWTDGTGGSEDG